VKQKDRNAKAKPPPTFVVMCGIHVVRMLGPAGEEERARTAVQNMMAACGYRGPDSAGIAIHVQSGFATALGHNRLAIRGGPASAQPYTLPGKGTLVYNGQLFADAVGSADTPALAAALATGDFAFMDRYAGMGAYIWLDAQSGCLTIGRDSFGIKPLFVAKTANAIVLSSEVRGIFASGLVDPKTDPLQLPYVLLYRCHPLGAGIYTNVAALAPGTYTLKGLDIEPIKPHLIGVKKEAVQNEKKTLKSLISGSILQHLSADRQVGILLSSGVDSGLLATLAAEHTSALTCFTTAGPESQQAQRLAKRLGFRWEQVPVLQGTDAWLAFIGHSPCPIADPGAYLTWCVAEAAQKANVPVLLSGAGADELFLGYRRQQAWYKLRMVRNAGLGNLVAPFLPWLDNRIKAALRVDSNAVGYGHTMACPRSLAAYARMPEPDVVFPAWAKSTEPLHLDLYTYLPDQLLAAADVYSMAHGVELRVPYLTPALRAWAHAQPVEKLLAQGGKAPIRELYASLGGAANKTKMGFGLMPSQYPNFAEIEEALGLSTQTHPIYAHIPYTTVQQWLKTSPPLQARMAYWAAGHMFHVEQLCLTQRKNL